MMATLLPLRKSSSVFTSWKCAALRGLQRSTLLCEDPRLGTALKRYIHQKLTVAGPNPKPFHRRFLSFQGCQDRSLYVHPTVAEALRQKEPVVALESTIITHGMPYPENVNTAIEIERIIQDNGVIPATVGVIEGQLIVGLTEDEIEFLGRKDISVPKLKLSRRDLAYATSKGISGGTTVSGTMIAAHKAGIPIFVTGGIGGVHRGASESFDVSADLTELGRTPVAVICAGVKSILDIGLTLEYLETQGVAVVKFGTDKEFPAFFTAKSGFKAPYNFEKPEDVAKMIDESLGMELDSGIVIGVPIPEKNSILGREIDCAIQEALKEARQTGIAGKDVTPFILDKVNKLTKGKSLEANISLIKNNAVVGARIALELSKIQKKHESDIVGTFTEPFASELSFANHSNKAAHVGSKDRTYAGRPVLIGGCNFDLLAVTDSYDVLAEVTNKGKLYQTFGGVARNVAECLARLDHDPLLISAVGEDSAGEMVMDHLNDLKMETRGIMVTSEYSTASYSAIMNNGGELLLGVGDMDIHDHITPEYIQDFTDDIKNAPIVLIDGNLTTEAIESVLRFCKSHQVPVWYEPADISKARKPFTTDNYNAITYISPNKRELQSIHSTITKSQEGMLNFNSERPYDFVGPSEDQVIKMCMEMSRHILGTINCLVVTLGRFGVLVLRNEGCDERLPLKENLPYKKHTIGLASATHYPAASEDLLPSKTIVSVSGAGDCLVGAMIASILRDDEPHTCVKAGLHAAFLSLQTHQAVSDNINADKFSVQSIEEWMTWSHRDIAV